ncbi:hypothetical protein [Undibacterium terreum]|uniref:hypothetical protein n=1 Tax=Undibacterium terreum TaxID=1224302 RepID=UPI001664495C|nr:hypothetical protein [Undibacterium terreum]
MKFARFLPIRGTTFPLITACLLLAGLLISREWLERSMLRHMLVQLPLLALCGYLFAAAFRRSAMPQRPFASTVLRRLLACDQNGVSGLFALLFISAYWMIPKALEECLRLPMAELLKFSSLILLGTILRGSLSRSNWIIQIFFLGNFCSMMAIAGMLYQDAPQRLCNAYLLDDQSYTGIGLVSASLVIAACWCLAQLPANSDKASSRLSASS